MAAVLAAVPLVTAVTATGVTATAAPAAAGTSPASTLTKTGADLTNGSTADSSTGTTGTAAPGDTIKWMLHYLNNTGSSATVNQTDPKPGPRHPDHRDARPRRDLGGERNENLDQPAD